MKTILEHLNTLGGKYRKEALTNCTCNSSELVEDNFDALEKAFVWDMSPEGFDYWNKYWNYLIDKKVKESLKSKN